MPDTVLWLRRDLRLHDHPALHAASRAADGGRVLPLFVLDPALLTPCGPPRRSWLLRSLRALHAATDGALVVRGGPPEQVLADVVRELGASSVHVTADCGPYGRRRDEAVTRALDVPLVRTGTPYAVGPGSVTKPDGTPYQVFTPFSRRWREHGWPAPAGPPPSGLRWARTLDSDELPDEPEPDGLTLPPVGEQAAAERWAWFLDDALARYADSRDRPDLDGTSALSGHLKFGEVHPRTLLADLAGRRGPGAEAFRTELAWREFYADVLWHHPRSARDYLRPEYASMPYDSPDQYAVQAWREGRTGFPFVDAGMRQLRATGWMHNRVRMVTASFLVKDLHVEWQHGARHFLHWLRDGDLASNNHGWQWVAGSGTDAAPYFRVFNPVAQGLRFDPDGDYVRRWVPELSHLAGAAAHEPWRAADGYADGYPQRVVDHTEERAEALRRYQRVRSGTARRG
ncbi:cryptochrome/photolyase family protein [Angustibacter sp. McL0619]|uniref:cryptochrome/photolyase family protein n=1 Tax=Angustibacter sp. McL0619 TaxID=3415676 RepID=UPI003CEA50CC